MLLLYPILHAFIVVVNFIVHVAILGLQLITARWPRFTSEPQSTLDEDAFISIHVPAHNEPPEMLMQTLQALSQLRWRNYEVLVIDNNTKDETLWRPVEAYCRELGPRFRFLHVERLKGFKAGAMNWARQFMNPTAKYIFVVDADYVVHRDALRRAVGFIAGSGIGLVQFPQEYRNTCPGNCGVTLDFKHFFAAYMNMANHLGCVPSTGTLTLINVEALIAVGGFDTRVVTEDAELGFRMNINGYRSLYVNEVIGHGLMPHDLESLKKQRWRWAFGNAQILKLNWRKILFGTELNWRQKLGYLTHLTAWFNFNLIPCLSILLLTPLAALDRIKFPQHEIATLSGFTLVTFMVLRFGTLFYGLRREGHSLREIWLAYLTHLGLSWIFSLSWVKCLLDHRSPFVRTNKFISGRAPGILYMTLAEVLIALTFAVACVVLAVTDFFLGPIGILVMAGSRLMIYWVWLQLRYTFNITKRLTRQVNAGISKPSDSIGALADKLAA